MILALAMAALFVHFKCQIENADFFLIRFSRSILTHINYLIEDVCPKTFKTMLFFICSIGEIV